jgi:phage gp36-like protein
MPYCTQTDLLEQISSKELISCTDDANAGTVDTSAVDRAIADADAEIDGYCSGRYTVPFSPVPAIIRKLSVDIAVYNVYSRRRGAPESRKQRYDNAIAFLKSISSGEVSLGADDPEPPTQNHQPQFAGNDRIFTRDKMSGF